MTTEGQMFGLFSGQGGASRNGGELNNQLSTFDSAVEQFSRFIEINPQADIEFYGHSLGAYASAVAAGVIKFDAGRMLVEHRTGFFADKPQGAMAIGNVDIDERRDILDLLKGTDVAKAIIYSDQVNVFAGNTEVIKELVRRFPDNFTQLSVIRAAHHILNAPVREKMRTLIEEKTASGELVFSDPKVTLYGSDGRLLRTGDEVKNDLVEAYVLPVNFGAVLRRIRETSPSQVIEFGGSTLSAVIRKYDLLGKEVTPAAKILNFESHRRAA